LTKLKSVLSEAPVLSLPEDDGEYVLDCDASNHSISAVLSQIQNGIEICYASQLYSKHEAVEAVEACSCTSVCKVGPNRLSKRNCWLLLPSQKKFRQYLLGRQSELEQITLRFNG